MAPGANHPTAAHGAQPAINGKPVAKNAHVTTLKNGNAVARRANGKVSDVHDAGKGMDIHNGLKGGRKVEVKRPDGTRLVSEKGRPGFVQHSYSFKGKQFSRRAYFYHGREYTRIYRSYFYRGAYFDVYAPYFYYGAGFYGWVYNPWYHPVVYGWGWGGAAWAGYYGFYFSPYPTYPGAAYWLTDYMISQDLQAEYQAEQDAQTLGAVQAGGEGPELTPDVKAMVATEVKNDLALENAEAQQTAQGQDVDPGSSGIARLLSDGQPHTFVTGDALDVVDANGTECALSAGDVLELATAPAADASAADLTVLASKGGGECPKSDTVSVGFVDLQEMQNGMRATIDQGLQQLQTSQGQGGLPPAPASAQTAPAETAYAQIAPPPDPNGATELAQTDQQATATEQADAAQAQQEGPSASDDASAPTAAPVAAPATIALGQSIDDVTTALGQPVTVIDLGSKKIYKYKDMKVTFVNGKVTDVE
jgi:hypothetical protein